MLQRIADDFVDSRDELPYHYQMHFMHGAQILGYKYPTVGTRDWWHEIYLRLIRATHGHEETEAEMDGRLGDSIEGWQARNDRSTSCTD